MADVPLSPQQVAFYKTFGFLSFPGLLADRADAIIEAFEKVWEQHGHSHSGKPHDGKTRSCIVPFADQSEYLASLLDDPRIHGIATSLLGDDFNYMASDGNYYAGDTGWHSDGWHTSPSHAKIALYLDPLTRDTGSIRVIPGSHIPGDPYAEKLQREIGRCRELWGVDGRDVPAVALETQPGDVVIFNHNTKHSAFGGNGWRRMFTLNLCERYPQEKIQDLRDYMNGWSRFWMEKGYHPIIINSSSPQRMRHLEQVLANDGHLKELSRKARESMAEPSRG